MEHIAIGEQLQMDFGFVHAKGFTKIDEYGHLITSIDGNHVYLLIIDRKTCCIWIMLARTNQPHIEFLKKFLDLNGRHQGRNIICTDAGGELNK